MKRKSYLKFLFAIHYLGPEPAENTFFPRFHEFSATGFGPKWTSWHATKLLGAAAAMAEANVGNNQSQFTIIPAPTESKTAGSTVTAANAFCSVTPKSYVHESAAANVTDDASAATITNGPGSDEPIPSTAATTTADAAKPTADTAADANKSTTAISKDDESCRSEVC